MPKDRFVIVRVLLKVNNAIKIFMWKNRWEAFSKTINLLRWKLYSVVSSRLGIIFGIADKMIYMRKKWKLFN